MRIFSILILFTLIVSGTAFANGNIIVDLKIERPGLLPTNPFYFLKEWKRGVKMLFTRNLIKKTELESQFNNERAAEIKEIIKAAPEDSRAIEKALEKYQESQQRLEDRLKDLPEASKNPNINKLLESSTDRAIRHEKLLEELQNKFKENPALQNSIKNSRNWAKEILARISEKDNIEKFSARVERMATEVRAVGALQSLKERLPEQMIPKVDRLIKKMKEQRAEDSKNSEKLKTEPKNPRPIPQIFPQERSLKKERPSICIQIYDPVCGKDGKTYPNSCMADIAGTKIKNKGECEIKEKIEATLIIPPASMPTSTIQELEQVEVSKKNEELKLEADDNGFYPTGTLVVPKGKKIRIQFIVRDAGVYFGGLDFRSPKFKTKTIKPGQSVIVEFVADESFIFSSYWPATGALKAKGEVKLE